MEFKAMIYLNHQKNLNLDSKKLQIQMGDNLKHINLQVLMLLIIFYHLAKEIIF